MDEFFCGSFCFDDLTHGNMQVPPYRSKMPKPNAKNTTGNCHLEHTLKLFLPALLVLNSFTLALLFDSQQILMITSDLSSMFQVQCIVRK